MERKEAPAPVSLFSSAKPFGFRESACRIRMRVWCPRVSKSSALAWLNSEGSSGLAIFAFAVAELEVDVI